MTDAGIQRPLPRAWLTVALLWPVAMLNYLDRQMLATMGLSLRADIAELQSAEKFGDLMAIFLVVYAICSPIGGWVADRVNRKWLIVLSLAVWSSVTLLMGHAHNFPELYWLRAGMGISEALYIPAGLALIADFHRGSTRSLAVGLHLSGLYMGQALGGIGGWIAQDVSWRAAFGSCGWFGVGYALVLVCFLREADRHSPAFNAANETGQPSSINWPGFALLLLCFMLPSFPGWAVKNWLPTLLHDRFAFDQKSSGLFATIFASGAGFLGVILGGRLSDAWFRRNPRGRTYMSAIGLLITVPALVGIGQANTAAVALACIALYGLAFGFFDTNNMPILCELAPPRFRATGYGLINFAGISAGAIVTPLLGRLKDGGVPLGTGLAICAAPAFLAAALMYFLGKVGTRRPLLRGEIKAAAV